MDRYTKKNRPKKTFVHMRKATSIEAYWVTEPFEIETQEGPMVINSEIPGWEEGYWVVYPSDNSSPYAISKSFVKDNYVPVTPI